MNRRLLGRNGPSVSVIGMALRSPLPGAFVESGDSDSGSETPMDALRAAVDAGINLLDFGSTEIPGLPGVGFDAAIGSQRDGLVVAMHCGLRWPGSLPSAPGREFDGAPPDASIGPDTLRSEVEAGLQGLGTDRIDLCQLHWPAIPPARLPIEAAMDCLLRLRAEGKIRAVGVCDVSVEDLDRFMACGGVVSNQLGYSMLHREAEEAILPRCVAHGLATLTYRSLEQGLLARAPAADRPALDPSPAGTEAIPHGWSPWWSPPRRRRLSNVLAGWSGLCAKYGCSLAQLVLAWTAAQPGVTHVLAGVGSVREALENARAGALDLHPADVDHMRLDLGRLLTASGRGPEPDGIGA